MTGVRWRSPDLIATELGPGRSLSWVMDKLDGVPLMPMADDLRGAARLASELKSPAVAFFISDLRDQAQRSRYHGYTCIEVRLLPAKRKQSWIEASSRLPSLERLAIVGLNVSPASAWVIAREMPQLQEIEISSTSLGDEGVASMIEALHAPGKLLRLALDNVLLTGAAFLGLGDRLRGLRWLSAADNALRDQDASRIAQEFPELVHLDLSGNAITDEGARALAQKLPHLVELDLTS